MTTQAWHSSCEVNLEFCAFTYSPDIFQTCAMRLFPKRVNVDDGIGKASRATPWMIRIYTQEGNAYEGCQSASVLEFVAPSSHSFASKSHDSVCTIS